MSSKRLTQIELPKDFKLSKRFSVIEKLGEGWEGEVYLIQEAHTGIERVAKVFFPHRNQKNKAARFYAQKLHKLRNCSILIHYLLQDQFRYKGHNLTYLISDFIEGETLDAFINRQPGKRLHFFQALHLLHALAKGLEEIHLSNEYHGDLHQENIIVQRTGLGFDLKVLDFYQWGKASAENKFHDVTSLIRIFYDSIGGAHFYPNQPSPVKEICCGLKKTLIRKKYKTASQLRIFLENLEWE
ncbi:MAG: protein kinase [Bdellovibrionales bacterium]|nr:protein kinase [Bdellovibrionales bacterium]